MKRQWDGSHISFGRLAFWVFLTMIAALGTACLIGGLLGEATGTNKVTEPAALQTEQAPVTAKEVTAPATAGQTTAQGGRKAGGVLWPELSEERLANLSNTTIGWGQGKEVNELNQPTGALQGQEKYGDLGGYFIMPDAGKTVYLTFDLGYENGFTPAILDTLKEKGVHGTFFVTMDYVKSAPDLVQRIIADGHILGNHSVHHPSMPSLTSQEAAAEITELHDYVRQNFGYEMTLFRFPRGEYSEKTMVQATELGYASVFWSYAYVDWKTDAQPDVTESLNKLVNAAHPGAIYLLHTVSATNAALMSNLIDGLRQQEYTVGDLPH